MVKPHSVTDSYLKMVAIYVFSCIK
jgi:hypothetical protein